MDTKGAIELIAAATMPVTFVAVVYRAIRFSLTPRSIQLAGLGMITPLILILGLEHILENANLGTLIGGLIGYAIAGTIAGSGPEPTASSTPPR